MKLETDIRRIEQLARQEEHTTWEFRSFLKGCGLSIEKIDSMVHALHEEVASQIDCAKCANCCRVVQPLLNSRDIVRLATYLGLTEDEFRRQYVREDDVVEGDYFRVKPCPFLRDNLCTVYPTRPNDCRSYPHLHKREFVSRVSQACFNCSVCPIVFNVYEKLKQELWHTGPRPRHAGRGF